MDSSIIVSIITGIGTIAGVILANNKTQAVMQTKIDELTREVREHNNFARRMPVVEEKLDNLEKRVSKLEK